MLSTHLVMFLGCNFSIEESGGVINSPGYPEAFPSNITCTWKLKANLGKLIKTIVMVTSIGLSPVCGPTDYLQVCSFYFI